MDAVTEFRESLTAAQKRSQPRLTLPVHFTDKERSELDRMRRAVTPSSATIAYCVYENPFAKSGGVFAVADNYCAALRESAVRLC